MPTTNSESIQVDEKYRIMGNKSAPVDDSGGLAMLPTNSDWVEFPAASTAFTYTSASRITITGILPSDRFQVGDKLRIKQTTYKYFYVIGVTDSTLSTGYIDVNAGSDYTVANATIQELGISRLVNPSGFPPVFNYTATPTDCTFQSQALTYSMQGSLVKISGNFSALTEDATNASIRMTFPFTLRSTSEDVGYVVQDIESSPTPAVGEIFGDYLGKIGFGTNGGDLTRFSIQRADGVDWDTLGSLVNGQLSFEYIY